MMNNPKKALELINKKKLTDYYRDDLQFRIKTEIQHMRCDSFTNNYGAVLERGSRVLKQISGAEQPRLFAECCNVFSVDVSVIHENNAVVTQFFWVKRLSNTGSKSDH